MYYFFIRTFYRGREGYAKEYVLSVLENDEKMDDPLADTANGYTHKFQVYTGNRLTKPYMGLVTMSQWNSWEVLSTKVIICMVTVFSPKLFKDLLYLGCFCTGTVRENRISFLKDLHNALPKSAEQGTSRWFREGDLISVKRKDTYVMSTFSKATRNDRV